MNATAEMIAGLKGTEQWLGNIFRRTDPERRRELIGARRTMMQQLWELKRHASGPECQAASALKQELAKRVSAIWHEVAIIQATWPATTIDSHASEHRDATRKTKFAIDEFFRWANRHFPPATPGTQEQRKVS